MADAVFEVRATRAGDAWERRERERAGLLEDPHGHGGAGGGASGGPVAVRLGMPGLRWWRARRAARAVNA